MKINSIFAKIRSSIARIACNYSILVVQRPSLFSAGLETQRSCACRIAWAGVSYVATSGSIPVVDLADQIRWLPGSDRFASAKVRAVAVLGRSRLDRRQRVR